MLLFVLSCATASIDVSTKFYHYAHGFCNGNIHNADIGNGNLVNSEEMKLQLGAEEHLAVMMLGAQHSQLSSDELKELGVHPGSTGNKTLGGCDEQHGNTCKKNGGEYHWCNYSGYHCMSKYAGQKGSVEYYNMNKKAATPDTYTMFYDNDFPRESSVKISKDMSTSHTQTLSVTVGMNVGVEMTVSAGEPEIYGESSKFSWSFDMHTTSTSEEKTTDNFEWAGDIPEDPESTTMLQLTVSKAKYSGSWKSQIGLPHYAKLWCGSRVNGHYEHFVTAKTFMGKGPYWGKGVFTGGAGLDIHATVKKCTLYAKTAEACDKDSEVVLTNKAKSKLKGRLAALVAQ